MIKIILEWYWNIEEESSDYFICIYTILKLLCVQNNMVLYDYSIMMHCIAVIKCIMFWCVILLHLQNTCVTVIISIWSLNLVPVMTYAWYKYNPYSTENKNFWSVLFRYLKSISTWIQDENWTEINFSVGQNALKNSNLKSLISRSLL